MKFTITKYNFAFFALMIFAASFDLFAQRTVVTPKPAPTAKPVPPSRVITINREKPEIPDYPSPVSPRETSEKSIKVTPKSSLSMCVLEGNVKINGWDRNEVRVFVKDGSSLDFKVLQTNQQNEPVWIMIQAVNPNPKIVRRTNECLSGQSIEIDAPRNASINIKGQETRTSIDSVRKAVVKNVGGNIILRNISEGVEASTYEGDVSVENSSGAMTLDSSSGNIIAFEVSPSEIGDIFKAKTNNGRIALQDLAFRQIEVNSISGSINFKGGLASGGIYNFGTSNGSINLTMPQNTSCKVVATYGFGGFNSELPINKETENNTPRTQRIVGTMGTGDATLNLTTSSGSINLKKKP
ncbi:MAG: DUF4097 domain-containing protein [Pyrinomonadaceae bacterium]|nr:DUF4097 domain-containing protein [Pyrinomonadaceae bacterium]